MPEPDYGVNESERCICDGILTVKPDDQYGLIWTCERCGHTYVEDEGPLPGHTATSRKQNREGLTDERS